jgi:G3E family GTPase
MNNGCICCTVRGDLIEGLKNMLRTARKQGKLLDGVLIETTGLADPAPVAQVRHVTSMVYAGFFSIVTLME